jgi:hypothetical protein
MARLINANGADVTDETLGAVRKVMGSEDGFSIEKAETITTAQNLVAYNLEAPSKNLYPVLTPLRNRIPRKTKGSGAGNAVEWKSVTGITPGGIISMPWIPEGKRAARMSVTVEEKSAAYKTIGLEADVSFEAQSAGEGFEDVLSTTGTRLLQQTMILEEYAILGGYGTVDLGVPATPTVTNAGTGGTVAAATYNVRVFGLTFEGYLAASLTGGIKRLETITGMDAKTYTLNGGSSKTSAAGSTTTSGATSTISATVTALRGAVAYAWFVGVAGSEKLEAITTINSVKLTALAATGQTYASIADASTDRSKNATAFDGLLYAAFNPTSLAYYQALDTGVAGTGTKFTASGRGTIVEIDNMLRSFWDDYRISPEEIFVNAQELASIVKLVFTDGANAMVRFTMDVNQMDPKMVAGQTVGYYMNPFTVAGGQLIPIKIHPNLPAGTLLAWTENLPAYYESSNVPQTCEIECRRDYYQIPWPIITRANETGVYAEEVLKVYATFCLGIITNIAPA